MSKPKSLVFLLLLTILHHPIGTTTSAAALQRRSMSMNTKVGVIGTTGRLGREAVQQLSSAKIPTRCLLRHPVNTNTKPPTSITSDSSKEDVASYLASLPHVEMVQGDVTDPDSLLEFVSGCTAILSLQGVGPTKPLYKSLFPFMNPESAPTHAKQVNCMAMQSLTDAIRAYNAKNEKTKCKRIVRITGKGEDPWSFFSILLNMLGSMAKAWNYQGELILRQCKDVDYTIIRPGIMMPADKVSAASKKVLNLADNGGDLKVSPVSYPQIASLCIKSLEYDNAARCTLTAMNVEEGTGEGDYGPLLEKVQADRRVFPTDMLERHRMAARAGAAVLVGVMAMILKGVLGLVGLVF